MDAMTVKTSLGYVFSAALIALGVHGLLDPVSYSTAYGIPAEDSRDSYVGPTCARTIGLGLATGALLYQGQKRAAGTVLPTAFVVGSLDTWITYRYAGQWTAAVLSHVWGDALPGAVGLWLMA